MWVCAPIIFCCLYFSVVILSPAHMSPLRRRQSLTLSRTRTKWTMRKSHPEQRYVSSVDAPPPPLVRAGSHMHSKVAVPLKRRRISGKYHGNCEKRNYRSSGRSNPLPSNILGRHSRFCGFASAEYTSLLNMDLLREICIRMMSMQQKCAADSH